MPSNETESKSQSKSFEYEHSPRLLRALQVGDYLFDMEHGSSSYTYITVSEEGSRTRCRCAPYVSPPYC
jgi:hypothetical protein